jgi:hypothetical protein
MRKNHLSLLLLSTLALAACQAAPVQQPQKAPDDTVMPQNPVPEVSKETLDGERLSMIEARVSRLEGDVARAKPTLQKMDVMQSHFRALSLELDRIEASYNVTADAQQVPKPIAQQPVAPKPVPPMLAPKPVQKPEQQEKAVAVSPKEAAVTSIRIGEQKNDVTRIVLDTTKPAEMKFDLDNGEHILMVELPGNKWVATKSMDLKSSPMVKSFSASSDETGSHLVIQLKMTAKVLTTARLNPSGAYGHRIYLDVVPSK